jgi:5-methylcytosine-specific restriction endonuclease McrA
VTLRHREAAIDKLGARSAMIHRILGASVSPSNSDRSPRLSGCMCLGVPKMAVTRETSLGSNRPSAVSQSVRPRFRFRMHPVVIANRWVKGKRCRDCKRFRNPTARWFHRDKNRPDGYQLYCKSCKRKRDQSSYWRHHEGRLASARNWKTTHKPELTAWRRTYNRAYRLGDRRRVTPEPSQDEAIRTLKLCSSCGNAFPPSDFPRGKRECRTCWYARQPKYRNPAKRAIYHQNRRAREVGKITPAEWLEILERYGHRCAYCGASGKLTIDHVVPLSKGGLHHPSNLVPACSSCNSRKHTHRWVPGRRPLTAAQVDAAGDNGP